MQSSFFGREKRPRPFPVSRWLTFFTLVMPGCMGYSAVAVTPPNPEHMVVEKSGAFERIAPPLNPRPEIEQVTHSVERKVRELQPDPAIQQTNTRISPTVQVQTGEPAFIPYPPPPYATSTYPTVIFENSTIALASPCPVRPTDEDIYLLDTEQPVCSEILLRRVGDETKLYRSTVKHGRAAFHELADGAYDVFYTSDDLNEQRLPDRRIIIESNRIAVTPVSNAFTKKNSPIPFDLAPTGHRAISPDLGMAVCLDLAMEQAQRGWELLEKHSYYSALREFQTAVHTVGKKSRQRASVQVNHEQARKWQELFDHKTESPRQIRAEKLDPSGLAKELGEYVGDSPEMAAVLYGLGRTYDAIGDNPKSLLPDAKALAVVCYLSALSVDPDYLVAANDLGVTCYHLGWMDKAASCFAYVTNKKPAATSAYNLARVQYDLGETEAAVRWWEQAVAWDPNFTPSYVELARLKLRENASALYPEDCQQLATWLNQVKNDHGADTTEHVWAHSVLNRLQLVGWEIRMNDPGLVQKHWYATLVPAVSTRQLATVPTSSVSLKPVADSLPTKNPSVKQSPPTTDKITKTPASLPFVIQPLSTGDTSVPQQER